MAEYYSPLVEKVAAEVERRMRGEGTGHDWFHVYRVHRLAMSIASELPESNKTVVALASLLHDVADWKFNDGDDDAGPREASRLLRGFDVDKDIIGSVASIIRTMSFKGAEVATPMDSVEGEIVQDADRLDAIGAVGIGRTFAFGGHMGRPMYDPDIPVVRHDSYEAYKASARNGTTLNHFYEKLLLLKDRMNTAPARAIAEKRTRYMEEFIDQFIKEWEGDA